MFDLNDEIQDWRKQLSGTGACYAKDVEELEAHLRDEIEHLTATGLTSEEGFLVARYRLGEAEALGREYSKVNPWAVWRFRFFWMAAGLLAMNLLGIISNLLNLLGVATIEILHIPTAYLGYWVGVSRIASWVLGLYLLWFIVHRKDRKQTTRSVETKARPLSRILLATIFVCLGGGGVVVNMLCSVVTYRLISPQEFSSFAAINAWISPLGSILLYIFLAGVVIYLYPRMFRASETV